MNSPEVLLAENGFYAATVHGHSMAPLLINHRDVVYIETTPHYRKGDVVLYRRPNGQLVLHRLIRCEGEHFSACGDNDFQPEKVEPSQILGVMTSFSRKGHTTKTTAFWYRVYSRVWNFSMPTKRLLRYIYRFGR